MGRRGNLAGGRAALILVLEGADGTYGFKKGADRPLPQTGGAGG